jgi:hypothetical protein
VAEICDILRTADRSNFFCKWAENQNKIFSEAHLKKIQTLPSLA